MFAGKITLDDADKDQSDLIEKKNAKKRCHRKHKFDL